MREKERFARRSPSISLSFPLLFLGQENIKNSIFFFYFFNRYIILSNLSVSECTRLCFLCLAVRASFDNQEKKKKREKKDRKSSTPSFSGSPCRVFYFPQLNLRHSLLVLIYSPIPRSPFSPPLPRQTPRCFAAAGLRAAAVAMAWRGAIRTKQKKLFLFPPPSFPPFLLLRSDQ